MYYGEVNAGGKRHGRGIDIQNDGQIIVGYWENGQFSTGNFIGIFIDGSFNVGEIYMNAGEKEERGTRYKTDGSTEKYV